MASPSRTQEREEERRFNLRTLVIASFASATAAVVTSQLWIAGTWIAAAMTPVLVALVSELVHRPTERIARRMTSERPALVEEPTPAEPMRDTPTEPAPVRVYRASTAPPRRRRKVNYGWVAGTAALALAIAVVALTVPELIAGDSLGNSGRTTFFSKPKKSSDSNEATTPATDNEDQKTETSQEETTEEPAPAEQTETETETVPTTEEPAPSTTQTSPAPSTTQP